MSNEHSGGSPANILVVDDEPESLRLLIDILSWQGYRVRPVPDGHQGLLVARTQPPDLILLDVMMPGMSGYELCEQLKADGATGHIPIIFISALTQVFDKVKAFSVGGVDYITKPFQTKEVLARVETHLTLHRVQQELQQRNLQLQQEVAERQQVEARLRQREQELKAVVDHSPDVIARFDSTYRHLYVSPAVERFTGLSPQQLIGRSNRELGMPAALVERWEEMLGRVFQTKQSAVFDFSFPSPEGTRYFESCLMPELAEDSSVQSVIGINRDITDRRKTELALQNLNEALQKRVEELTALNLIGQTVATVTDLQTALETVTETVAHLFNLSGSAIYLVNSTRFGADMVASFYQPPSVTSTAPATKEARAELDSLVRDDPAARRALEKAQPVFISRGQSDPAGPPLDEQGRPNIHGLLAIPLQTHGEAIGLLTLVTDQPEREFSRVEESLAETIAGQIAGALEVARLFEQERQQRQLAESLRRVTGVLSSSLERPTVLNIIFEQLRQVLAYDGASVGLVDNEDLIISETVGLSDRYLGHRLPLKSDGAPTQVLRRQQALILTDVAESEYGLTWFEDKEVGSWMGVPLVVGQSVIGLLAIEHRQAGSYREEDAQILQTFANQAAIAIENTRLYEQAQTVAIDAERQRLARELHDSVTQSLYSLTLLANGWATMARQGRLDSSQVVEHFKQLEELSLQALKEMRLLLHQLRPPILVEVGLVGALQQRLDTVEQRVNVETRLLTRGEIEAVPLAWAEQLFFIAQEALNNTLRHAQASTVTVRIEAEVDCLRLTVEDDGIGFDSGGASSGLGLETIRERAEGIGGQVEISSAPGQGTTVLVTVGLEGNREICHRS